MELSEDDTFRFDAVVDLVAQFPAASARRVGRILETFGGAELNALAAHVAPLTRSPSRLDPGGPSGTLDDRWNIRLNADVEPDL